MENLKKAVVFALLAAPPAVRPDFVHPGLLNTQAEFDYIKAAVNGPLPHPMQDGFRLLKSWYRSGLHHAPRPEADVLMVRAAEGPSEKNFRDDSHAAYAHALQWVVTGNAAHKEKAIEILNAWSRVFQRMVPEDKQNQLEASWVIPIWAAAAEIIRHYRGGGTDWAAADVQRFSTFLRRLYAYVPKTFEEKRKNNWGSSAALAALAAGVFLEDNAIFQVGKDYFNYLMPYQVERTGLLMETCRDCNHAEYNIIGMLQAAEIAWKQGLDYYGIKLDGQSTPRLLMGMEFHANALLGTPRDVGQSCGTLNCSREDKRAAAWETGLYHYRNRLGLAAPISERFVLTQNRPSNITEFHFAGWSTLTHAELGKSPSAAMPPDARYRLSAAGGPRMLTLLRGPVQAGAWPEGTDGMTWNVGGRKLTVVPASGSYFQVPRNRW